MNPTVNCQRSSNVNLLPVFRYLSTIVLGEVEQID